ncbi:MAG: hypothetical protein WAU39_13875 [Polyangiales bacterium]
MTNREHADAGRCIAVLDTRSQVVAPTSRSKRLGTVRRNDGWQAAEVAAP